MTLLALATAFVSGVFLASQSDVSVYALWLLLLASALALVHLIALRRFSRVALVLPMLVLGMLRVEAFEGEGTSALDTFHSRLPVEVEGVVTSDPESVGAATRFRLRVHGIRPGGEWFEASGDALVTLRESARIARQRDRPYFRYGDRLLLRGALEAPPELEEFDYPAYLARQGIGSVMSFPAVTFVDENGGLAFYRWLYGLRRRLADSVARVVPEPQASIGQALLLGLRRSIPEQMVTDFQTTGTSHVLAISGLHVGTLLGISLAVSRGVLGRRRQLYLILPLVAMWLYALLSGMSPSVVRASIMGTVYLAALLLGRPRSVLPALGLAAGAMVAAQPSVLLSVSFQLSFAAVGGIAVLGEPLAQRLRRLNLPVLGRQGPIDTSVATALDIVAMTIAATVATLPLIAFYFQRVSLVGLPTTVLILPALPLVLVTQGFAALIGMLNASVAEPFGWVAWVATGYLSGTVHQVARLPGASFETGQVAPLLVWAYYAVLVLSLAGVASRRVIRGHVVRLRDAYVSAHVFTARASWWLVAPVVAVAALLWIAALSVPDPRLRVAFVDVGQGDAAFISTPGGQQILVDGGPDPLGMVRFLGDKMPFRDRTIELVVLTHIHSDHVNGLLEVLRRYDVERILERHVEHDGPPYQAWRRAVKAEGADVIQARAGQVVVLDGGAFIEIVSPGEELLRGTSSDVDNASVVLRLVYGDVSFLLTGDLFGEGERALVNGSASLDSDVLKVGHHGSRTSSSPGFLDAVSPAAAVISVGQDNRFGHPDPETFEALKLRVPENLLFLTKDRGNIEFTTDGKSLLVKTER